MRREIAAVLKDPEVQQQLQTAYFDSVGSTPEEMAKFLPDELQRWKPVIVRIGLTPDQESRTNAELAQSSLTATM